MKNRKILFWVLLGFSFLLGSFGFIENMRLNKLSKTIVESIFNQDKLISAEGNCKNSWLTSMNNINLNGLESSETYMMNFLNCSRLHVSMIQDLYPSNNLLASEANKIYPNDKDILFWVYRSSGSDYETKELAIKKILSIDPDEANAWTALGKIYIDTKRYESALNAFMTSCELNDRTANGCYYVGWTYQLMKDYENAIIYFRKSYWPPSWERANQLEAQLSSQNP
jgi:tetratricopeptide (TPR) repeat protein